MNDLNRIVTFIYPPIPKEGMNQKEIDKQIRREKEREKEKELEEKAMVVIRTIRAKFEGMKFHIQGKVKRFEETDCIDVNAPRRTIYMDAGIINEYYDFALTTDGRIFVCNQFNSDTRQNICSDEKAPQAYVEVLKA